MPEDQDKPSDLTQSQIASSEVDGPSVEEVIERLQRVCPDIVSRLAVPDLTGQRIGQYTVRRVVGQGAFGVVYQAFDEQLKRDVAIKVPRPDVLFDKEKLRRFESEAATAATLKHPLIIPIYEANLSGPAPFIASAFCAGPNLGQWLESRHEPIPVEQAARFLIKLAEAVHYAHSQGILHRDLKPANILLERSNITASGSNQLDQFDPRLTDFGLAKLIEGSQHDTRSSLMIGTPLYMAPEQIDPQIGDVSVTTDVYALGVIFYELLVGKPTFQGKSHVDLLVAIREQEVTPPSRIRLLSPRTLDIVCLKALEKKATSRYSSALEFAEDLGRYLRGEQTRAKPLAFHRRAVNWIQTNPWATGLFAVVSISIVGMLLGVLWHNQRLSEQLIVSNELRVESTKSAKRYLRARYIADINLAQRAIAEGRFSEARSRLNKYQPSQMSDQKIPASSTVDDDVGERYKTGVDIRDLTWHLLSNQLKNTIVAFDSQVPATTLAVSTILDSTVTGGKDGKLRFFDNSTGKQIAVANAHEGDINSIVLAADGVTLVCGGDDGVVSVWDASSLRETGTIKLLNMRPAHNDDVLCIAIAPDGQQIATGSSDGRIFFWNFQDLSAAGELAGHTDWVRAIDFSPEGKFLASGSDDGTIRRWDVENLTEIGRLTGHDKYVLCLQHHPTEPLLASGGKDRSIRLWDLNKNEQSQTLQTFNGWVRSLAFSEDGKSLAATADEPRVIVFKRASDGLYEQAKVAFTDGSANYGIAFTKSEKNVAFVGLEGIGSWSFDAALDGTNLCQTSGDLFQLIKPSKDMGFTLLSNRGLVEVHSEARNLVDLPSGIWDAAASDDRNRIAFAASGNVVGKEETFLMYDRVTDSQKVLLSQSGGFYGVAVSSSGRVVAVGTSGRMIRVWQAPNFQDEHIVRIPSDFDFGSFIIDETRNRLFIPDGNNNELLIVDIATSEQITKLRNVERIVGQSGDSRYLVIAHSEYSVSVYDTYLNQIVQKLPSQANEVVAACISPVEELLATLTRDGEITFWALDTGDMLIQFQAGFDRPIAGKSCLAFASDGNTLVVASRFHSKNSQFDIEVKSWQGL